MCELSCVLRLWFQYHWIEIEKSNASIETPLDDLLQVPLRAADSRLQFQQGANNLKVNILIIFIFLTIRSGLLTSQSPGPLWRGSSSTSLSPASHWSQFLCGGIIKDNKQLWQIIKDNLTTTNQNKIVLFNMNLNSVLLGRSQLLTASSSVSRSRWTFWTIN